MQPSFKQVLLNIISTIRSKKIITSALNSLCEMINDKLETIKLIDGEDLFNSSLFILSRFHNKNYDQICQPALILLSRCLCFFDAPEQLIIKSASEIHLFLNTKQNFIKPFIINLINKISYHQSERALNFFADDIIKYTQLLAAQEIDSTKYAEDIFGALNNMVYRSDDFAIFVPSCTLLFDIQADQEWSEKAKDNFILLQGTIFQRMRKHDRKEENWGKAILNIRKHTESIITNGISFLGSSSYKLKKSIILMFCQLIQISDIPIYLEILLKHIEVIQILIEYLDCNNYKLDYEIASTLYLLCKSSPINGNVNVFDILNKTDLYDIAKNIVSEATIDPEPLRIFIEIQQMAQQFCS